MGDLRRYELPGDVEIRQDDCGMHWSGFCVSPIAGHDPPDLGDVLDAAERYYREMIEEHCAGLEATARIRAAEGLGVLQWVDKGHGVWRATAANGAVRYEVMELKVGDWCTDETSGDHYQRAESEDESKAVCEGWYAEWLKAAGLEVKRG